jgi:uncharacterized protein
MSDPGMIDPGAFNTGAVVLAAAAALLGGFCRGLLGFGGALILAPALAYLVEPVILVPLIMLADIPANVGLIKSTWREWDRRFVALALAGTVVGAPAGVFLLLVVDAQTLTRVIFAVVAAAALLLMSGWRYQGRLAGWQVVLAGWGNGVTLGATSIATGMVPIMFGGTATVREARANMIVWVTFSALFLLGVIFTTQGVQPLVLKGAALIAPVYLSGVYAGAHWFRRVNEELVRKIVIFALLASALFGLFR